MKTIKYNNFSSDVIVNGFGKDREFICEFHRAQFNGYKIAENRFVLHVEDTHRIKVLKVIPNVSFEYHGGYLMVDELIMDSMPLGENTGIKAKKVDITDLSFLEKIDLDKVTAIRLHGDYDITNDWGAKLSLYTSGRAGKLRKVVFMTSGWMYFSRNVDQIELWERLDKIFKSPVKRIALDSMHTNYIIEREGDWSLTFRLEDLDSDDRLEVPRIIWKIAMHYKPLSLSKGCSVEFKVRNFSIK